MNQVKLSRLENIVAEYILEIYPSLLIVPQARVIKRTKKTRYEIDLYLPLLSIGFEIQDFATHSRTETTAKNPWGKRMKGPAYHRHKKTLAANQLAVEIIELWEDEIVTGSYKKIVIDALSRFDLST